MTASLPTPARIAQAVLDPRTLGRPVHLLGRFADQLRDDFGDWLRSRLNLRYRARFEVDGVRLHCTTHIAGDGVWRRFGDGAAAIDALVDRDVVLSVMAYRYGLRAALSANGEAPRETATEERLATQLAQQFSALVAARIDAGIGSRLDFDQLPALAANGVAAPALAPAPLVWIVDARVREQAHDIAGGVRLMLGEAAMARLWQSLAPLRAKPAALPEQATPLAGRLGFRLVARLLHKEMPLGELAELRVGDVLPISLGATDVLIDDARLFTAAVAEHQGKLCLTSFAEAD